MQHSAPSLLIVGAGPGDPDLITVKGLNAIRKADVVLYDALVSQSLLQQISQNCKLVFVGKRKGRKEFSQHEINQLLVFYAKRYRNVVRLKGGDPFVFGRGQEELNFLMKHDVNVNVIPGISSSYAAASSAGIPLTVRGVNESFWVVAGTVSDGTISSDLGRAAGTNATIVVLMGLSHLKEIAKVISMNRGEDEPMAVIQNATLPGQKVVAGVARDIYQLALDKKIASPAVIVIGKVVNLKTFVNPIPELCETDYATRRPF